MSSEIKNTIGLLCKLVNLIYKTDLKPEHFRLAKFNKSDENIVPILWNTLQIILDINNSTSSIKKSFYNMNYNRKEFYTLNKASNHGSRELLLALVFLLSATIENDLQKRLGSTPSFDMFNQLGDSQGISSTHENFNWLTLNENDLQNYKKWLCGKVSSNNNMILEYKEHIDKIQKKYNESLNIKAHSKLTIYEILALKNKTIGEQFLQDTEAVVQIMTIYTEWTKKEKIFWKWMGTVLEEVKTAVDVDT